MTVTGHYNPGDVLAFPDLDLDAARAVVAELEPDAAILGLALEPSRSPTAALVTFFHDAAVKLYPAWLPAAEPLESMAGAGLLTLRQIARQASNEGLALNAVVEALAIEAVTGNPASLADLADETIVRQIHRLLSRAYEGMPLVVVIALPAPGRHLAIDHALLWLSGLGLLRIRLCGPGASAVLFAKALEAPAPATEKEDITGLDNRDEGDTQFISPVTGYPSPNSPTEQRVERLLARCEWARGRRWQVPWQADTLSTPIRLDLMFPEAMLVVEFDGVEHLGVGAYCADRRRDRLLAAAGYRVIRFTNGEVATDVSRVADEIQLFVQPFVQPNEDLAGR